MIQILSEGYYYLVVIRSFTRDHWTVRECREGGYSQTAESENTAQSNLLCPWLMKTPNIWDWEKQKSPVCDDIGHCTADEESVHVHGTSWVHRVIPLGHCRVSTLLGETGSGEVKETSKGTLTKPWTGLH